MVLFERFDGNSLMCRKLVVNNSEKDEEFWFSEVELLNAVNCAFEYILAIVAAGVNPILICVSVLGNSAIIRRLPGSAVSRKAKFFYISSAVSDLLCTVVVSLYFFVGQGLRFLTNGSMYFYAERQSTTMCHLVRVSQALIVVFSNSLTMTLAIERCVATASPLTSVTLCKLKYSSALIACFNLLGLLIVAANIPTYNLESNLDYAFGKGDLCNPVASTRGTVLNALLFSYLFVTPFTVVIVCCAVTLLALRKRNQKMRTRDCTYHLIVCDHACVHVQLILMLSVVNFVIYGTFVICWMSYLSLTVTRSIYFPTMRRVANAFLLLSGISHSLNFIVFMVRSKSFRDAVLRVNQPNTSQLKNYSVRVIQTSH